MASLTDLLLSFGRAGGSAANASAPASLDFGTQAGSLLSGGAASTPGGTPGIMAGLGSIFSGNSLFGGANADGTVSTGWAAPAVGIAQAVMGGINGRRQLGLAEDSLKQSKREFDLNYGAQRQTTNTQLEDRQRARVASSPGGGYESVSTYLDKNRIR